MAGAMAWMALALLAQADVAPRGAGTITVAVSPDSGLPGPAAAALAEGVGDALTERQFLILPGRDVGRYTAIVTLERHEQGSVTAPGSAVAATSGGLGNWGASARVTLPTRKQGVHALIMTTMTLSIVSRSDGRRLWTGSALTAQVDGSAADAPAALGRSLGRALMSRYPEPVDGTVSVP